MEHAGGLTTVGASDEYPKGRSPRVKIPTARAGCHTPLAYALFLRRNTRGGDGTDLCWKKRGTKNIAQLSNEIFINSSSQTVPPLRQQITNSWVHEMRPTVNVGGLRIYYYCIKFYKYSRQLVVAA